MDVPQPHSKDDPEIRELICRSDDLMERAKRLMEKTNKTPEQRLALRASIREISETTKRLARLSVERGRRVIG